MRTVHKFATGQALPEGAKYLCTKVEFMDKIHARRNTMMTGTVETETVVDRTNALVWHYYEVDFQETK